jgi:hypothetical protein
MAIVIASQKMTVRHGEGEHTIFPSPHPQSLPDHLLEHDHVKGAIQSKWIVVKPSPESAEPVSEEPQTSKKKRSA